MACKQGSDHTKIKNLFIEIKRHFSSLFPVQSKIISHSLTIRWILEDNYFACSVQLLDSKAGGYYRFSEEKRAKIHKLYCYCGPFDKILSQMDGHWSFRWKTKACLSAG